MKNKILVITLVVVVAVLALYSYNTFLAPASVEGAKEVTIEVVIEKEEVDESFTFNTDLEYLYNLLEENKETLGFAYEESNYGKMLAELMNYNADESKNEYFHIYVNGEDATIGMEQIPLVDGYVFRIELKKW